MGREEVVLQILRDIKDGILFVGVDSEQQIMIPYNKRFKLVGKYLGKKCCPQQGTSECKCKHNSLFPTFDSLSLKSELLMRVKGLPCTTLEKIHRRKKAIPFVDRICFKEYTTQKIFYLFVNNQKKIELKIIEQNEGATMAKKKKRPLIVYGEEGDKTLVLDCGNIPSSNSNDKSDIQSFIVSLNPKQSLLCEGVEISLRSKGLSVALKQEHGEKGNIVCDILFVKGVKADLPKYFTFKHFSYDQGYQLLPYLGGMHKAYFSETV